MAHELAGLQSVYKFKFDEHGVAMLEKQQRETVDFRHMEENGNLEDGVHVTPQTAFQVKGRAYKHHGETYLTFSHQDHVPGTFFGQVVFRQGENVIVFGTISTADGFNARAADGKREDGQKDQQDQPIVITKP